LCLDFSQELIEAFLSSLREGGREGGRGGESLSLNKRGTIAPASTVSTWFEKYVV